MYDSVLVLGEQQSYSYTHKLYIYIYTHPQASLVAQTVKNLTAMQET